MDSRRVHLRLDHKQPAVSLSHHQLTPFIQFASPFSSMFHPGLNRTFHSLQAVSSTDPFFVPATTSDPSVIKAPSNRIHPSCDVEFVLRSSLTVCWPIGRSLAAAPVLASDPLKDIAELHVSSSVPGEYARSNDIADPVKLSSIDAFCPPVLIQP